MIFYKKGEKIELVARPGELWKHLVGYRGFRSCVTKDCILYYYVVVLKGNWKNVSADLEHTALADIVCRREVIDRSQYNVHLILAYLARG